MPKTEFPPSEALYPAPVVLVSCGGKPPRKANIITIAWCGVVCSVPPLISISIRPSRYSHHLIKKTRDFVINIPAEGMLKKVDWCGVTSGKSTDKFTACKLTKLSASKVSPPLIKECPVNIECALRKIVRLGSHDMFIGEVLMVHVSNELLDKKGRIDFKKAKPFVYNQGEYWGLGNYLGLYGCSNR